MGEAEAHHVIDDLLEACRSDAAAVAIRHQKDASRRLYAVLAKALKVCEVCLYDIGERTRLEELFRLQPATSGRRYVERGSDVYTLVCRYVFNQSNHANISRYSNTLREAAKRQLRSDDLYEFLATKGGVNELFLGRPVEAASISTKCLRLDRTIKCQRLGSVTLSLTRMRDGVFKVDCEEARGGG